MLPIQPLQATAEAIDYFSSPIGWLKIQSLENALTGLSFTDKGTESESTHAIQQEVKEQLTRYFEGSLQVFTIPLLPAGTAFQQKVWDILKTIPFGTTTTYLQQSKQLGDVKAIRAMASANGKNPIAILLPCHRVIGSNGSLTGYAGELWRKNWLLEHEAKVAGKWNKLF